MFALSSILRQDEVFYETPIKTKPGRFPPRSNIKVPSQSRAHSFVVGGSTNRMCADSLRSSPFTAVRTLHLARRAVKLGEEDSQVRRSRGRGSRVEGRGSRQTSRRLDEQFDRIRTFGYVCHGEGVDTMIKAIEVHRVEAVDVQFAEIVLGDHGEADTLRLLRLRLVVGNLELRRVEVHELRLDVLLRLRLGGLLDGCDGWLPLLLLLLLRLRLPLLLGWEEDGRVLADVVDEGREGWVAEECLDEAAVALILLHESCVLIAEGAALLRLHGHFALELGDVLCIYVSITLRCSLP